MHVYTCVSSCAALGHVAVDFQRFCQLTLELHKVWHRLCVVSRPNMFVFCDSSCGSSVAATWTLFSVLFRVCATNKFQVVLCPSHQILSTPQNHKRWRNTCSLLFSEHGVFVFYKSLYLYGQKSLLSYIHLTLLLNSAEVLTLEIVSNVAVISNFTLAP